jgi:type IV secretion system protein VirB5
MHDQLNTAKSQLTQAQATVQAMTGGRGMQQLLAGAPRNYLPADWAELEAAIADGAGAYSVLSTQTRELQSANAVLSPEQLGSLSAEERQQVESARRSTAMLRALTRQALSTTSARFASIQQLINAIGSAQDQKAILDLQARIAAEQGMLQNEQTKLGSLYQAAQAEEWARVQREREQAIADVGSLRHLPAMGLDINGN